MGEVIFCDEHERQQSCIRHRINVLKRKYAKHLFACSADQLIHTVSSEFGDGSKRALRKMLQLKFLERQLRQLKAE